MMITRIETPSFPTVGNFGWSFGDMNTIRRPLDIQLYQVLVRVCDTINDSAIQSINQGNIC